METYNFSFQYLLISYFRSHEFQFDIHAHIPPNCISIFFFFVHLLNLNGQGIIKSIKSFCTMCACFIRTKENRHIICLCVLFYSYLVLICYGVISGRQPCQIDRMNGPNMGPPEPGATTYKNTFCVCWCDCFNLILMLWQLLDITTHIHWVKHPRQLHSRKCDIATSTFIRLPFCCTAMWVVGNR